jgi:hypothetical protein
MKLTNTTKWSDTFLRRMVSWACKEVGYPVRNIRLAKIVEDRGWGATGSSNWSNHTKDGSLTIKSGTKTEFSDQDKHELERIAHMVYVTAGQIFYLHSRHVGHKIADHGTSQASRRRKTKEVATRIRESFTAHGKQLIDKWNKPRARKKEDPNKSCLPKQTPKEKKVEAAKKMLATWERKNRLAQTKVKTWQKNIVLLERAAAKERVKMITDKLLGR